MISNQYLNTERKTLHNSILHVISHYGVDFFWSLHTGIKASTNHVVRNGHIDYIHYRVEQRGGSITYSSQL